MYGEGQRFDTVFDSRDVRVTSPSMWNDRRDRRGFRWFDLTVFWIMDDGTGYRFIGFDIDSLR